MGRRLGVLCALVLVFFTKAFAEDKGILWRPWSDTVFAQAETEGRFVLLDLGTGWCH